ncbi:DUF7472 family protein [Natronosalvus rutilus]|uniref:Uncharacterized protein n=1 Tax=Natronosalvus rutilus TaxID=2953753 RepID=A0A9E7NC03_9EURY|nr:hypothetical protein [Natronosalvus rutilus]UTF53902.1 hypothetical protein NGM29_01050 [Natronosalvus rutilus]
MLERERLIEIGIAIPMVAIMIGAMMVVGENHKTNGTLTPEGGQLLVGTIIGFVVLMLAVGIALAYVTNDSTDASA